jgi:chemotaxis signal transduction protein
VSVENAQIQSVPSTAAGSATNFLSGLVTHEDTMIALIDLPNLLSTQSGDTGVAKEQLSS